MLAWGIVAEIVIVNGINVRLLLSPDELRGRAGTTGRMVAWGGQPFGALIGGAPASTIGIRSALVIVGVISALGAAAAWLSPLRDRDLVPSTSIAPEIVDGEPSIDRGHDDVRR